MKLYTINATPVRTREQMMSTIGRAMPSDKVLSDSEVASLNEVSIKEYPSTVAGVLEASGISGCTIEQVMGFWKNKPEVSFKIQVATDSPNTLRKVCESLRDAFNQDAVMLTLPDNEVEFI